ncbi:MAG: enoyl-CoA hydratase/isomerase family protein [Acidobacteriota bacterium]|nr:enoyl-CoA hydratase/isomerase family protein [Acidobacteriota bacterium]
MNFRKSLAVENFENITVIRFIRPEIKNPLSIETLRNLKEIFPALESNPNIKTIIFTGSGDTFASGANLNEIADTNADNAREFALRGQNLMQKIHHSNKFTVAAIDGFCMGGALDLALSCKVRIASLRSVFAHPGVGLGIITGWGGTQMLPRLIGEAKALELFLTAKRVEAGEALDIGLIDKIEANPLEFALANYGAKNSSIDL